MDDYLIVTVTDPELRTAIEDLQEKVNYLMRDRNYIVSGGIAIAVSTYSAGAIKYIVAQTMVKRETIQIH